MANKKSDIWKKLNANMAENDGLLDFSAEKIENSLPLNKRPSFYEVCLKKKNEDLPNDLIVTVILNFFHKNVKEAESIVSKLAKEGTVPCMITTKEIAEIKIVDIKSYIGNYIDKFTLTMQKVGNDAIKKS